jgi:hypothetical protein
MAKWLAYQLSVWHEIATYYGYASIAEWLEKISAFSPEDLYSNELGARLSAGIMLSRGARTDVEYGLSMDSWIHQALERLDAMPLRTSQKAMHELDGAWYDSQRPIPDWKMVKRRNFDIGPLLHPWLVQDASPGIPDRSSRSQRARRPLRPCCCASSRASPERSSRTTRPSSSRCTTTCGRTASPCRARGTRS